MASPLLFPQNDHLWIYLLINKSIGYSYFPSLSLSWLISPKQVWWFELSVRARNLSVRVAWWIGHLCVGEMLNCFFTLLSPDCWDLITGGCNFSLQFLSRLRFCRITTLTMLSMTRAANKSFHRRHDTYFIQGPFQLEFSVFWKFSWEEHHATYW